MDCKPAGDMIIYHMMRERRSRSPKTGELPSPSLLPVERFIFQKGVVLWLRESAA